MFLLNLLDTKLYQDGFYVPAHSLKSIWFMNLDLHNNIVILLCDK